MRVADVEILALCSSCYSQFNLGLARVETKVLEAKHAKEISEH